MYIPVEREGVVERTPHIPQKLTKKIVEDVVELAENSKDSIIFFNSIHAGASVDHLHIQQLPYSPPEGGFAIEKAGTKKYKGRVVLADYPMSGLVHEALNSEQIWKDISALQDREKEQVVPLNWITMQGKSYIIPRKKEFERVKEFPNIFASYELAGKIITDDLKFYTWIAGAVLEEGFRKMSLPLDMMLDFVHGTPTPGERVRQEVNFYNPCSNCAEKLTGVGGDPCLGCSHAS